MKVQSFVSELCFYDFLPFLRVKLCLKVLHAISLAKILIATVVVCLLTRMIIDCRTIMRAFTRELAFLLK